MSKKEELVLLCQAIFRFEYGHNSQFRNTKVFSWEGI